MKRADVILFVILLLIGIAGCALLLLFRSEGSFVSVMVDGKETVNYPLQKDGEYLIVSEDGGENLLCIENGYVRVSSANCPNQDCVQHKAISSSNESIICLPHKVVITIFNSEKKSSIDTMVQ